MANEDQKVIVNNKKAFEEWMKNKGKISGGDYNPKTPQYYVEVLSCLPGKFLPENSPCKNIFNIDDIEEFVKIRDRIMMQPGYENFNKKPTVKNFNGTSKEKQWVKDAPTAALNRYLEFLCRNGGSIYKPLPYDYFRSKAEAYSAVDEKAEKFYQKFRDQGIYYWRTLDKISGEDILDNIFLPSNRTEGEGGLLHELEYNSDYDMFGASDGGKSSKYGIYLGKDNKWKNALERENGNPKSISKEEAIKIGITIRDALVKGAQIIEKWQNSINTDNSNTTEDYRKMFEELNKENPDYIKKTWVLKYYHMSFPSIFPAFYSEEWQKHILYSLHIMPDENVFIRISQIACYIKKCNISSAVFAQIAYAEFGKPKTFYRIGIGEGKKSFFNDWRRENYVAIGWKKLGNLNNIYKKEFSQKETKAIKEKICDVLKDMGYDNNMASRKYGEINEFYNIPKDNSYIVAMKGTIPYGIGKITGNYEYKGDKEYAHCRPVEWQNIFSEENCGPAMIGERRNTTFSKITKDENILRLYTMLHGPVPPPPPPEKEHKRNLIFFGAPGTGKSHDLNRLKDNLFKDHDGDYERVTFHPDYSYAHFFGTYKPVVPKKNHKEDPEKDEMKGEITYKYVPGPFMRIYVKAKQTPEKKFLLIIEEINRANVAAVFGDVFQLLDRTKDGGSEYPVAASEDVQEYLRSEGIEDYEKIAIPPNMYIWATMNSADQGVFLMDTAFKRRWEFKYLGIDHGEDAEDGNGIKIGDKEVPLGNTGKSIGWNILRKTINELLASENINVNEDKQLGMFFINMEIIDNAMKNKEEFNETFKNKVLMYLFEDAAKHRREQLFGSKTIRYSKVCQNFDEKGLEVFVGGVAACEKVQQEEIQKAKVKEESKSADESAAENSQNNNGTADESSGENN